MPYFEAWLTTLEHVKQHRVLTSSQTTDDAFLKTLIAEASSDFVQALGRLPFPYTATLLFDALGPDVDLFTLKVPDLLAVTTLTNGDGTVITSGQYVLESANDYPKWRVKLRASAGLVWAFDDDPEQAISIAGAWGYVPHYAYNAFTDSGVDGTLAAPTTTTMNIGQNAALFETGQYVRIGSELLQITAITDNTTPTEDVLTMTRAEWGTTAAVHTGADIETYQPLKDIRGAVRELVVYRYKKRNEIGSRVSVFQGGTVVVEDLDPSVQKCLDRHRKDRFRIGVA